MEIIRKFSRIEPYLFYFTTILNMLPIFLFQFFPTMDGAAHLYNSNLINELLFNADTQISDFYLLNSKFVPNWIGHFILSIFNLFLPAFLAEKMLLLSYFILLPLSFRKLIKHFNKPFLSYLIFPFTYSFLFYLGFYNLSLSYILLFLTLAFWLKTENQLKIKSLIILFILITLTYFSHILIYSLLLFTLFILITLSFIRDIINTNLQWHTLKGHVKKYWYLLLSSLLTLVLLIIFISTTDLPGTQEKLPASELIKWIKDVRPIIALIYDQELKFTKALFLLMIGLTIIIVYHRIKILPFHKNLSSKDKIKYLINNGLVTKRDIFLLGAFVTIIFYFLIPNSSGAGMMSDRFCLLFFIFYIIWLAVNSLPGWIIKISIIIILYVNFSLVFIYAKATNSLNRDAKTICHTAKFIEPYSTVLPINRTNHWLEPHFSNYLGIDKPIIILENYEADVGWFPVKWNDESIPKLIFGNIDNETSCLSWKSSNLNKQEIIDYVFIWGYNRKENDCQKQEVSILTEFYKIIYSSPDEFVKLYRLKTGYR